MQSLHLNCEFSHNSHNLLVVLRKHNNPQLCCGTRQKLHVQCTIASINTRYTHLRTKQQRVKNTNMAHGHEQSSVFNYRHWFTCNTYYMTTQMAEMAGSPSSIKIDSFLGFTEKCVLYQHLPIEQVAVRLNSNV